jgi:hypothetical protein
MWDFVLDCNVFPGFGVATCAVTMTENRYCDRDSDRDRDRDRECARMVLMA